MSDWKTPKVVDQVQPATLPDRSRHAFDLNVVRLGDGSTLRIPVNVVAGRGAKPCLVAVAGIHGNEADGILALAELWEELEPELLNGRLVMVPVANPGAFAAGQRRSPADDLDLNRVFPGVSNGQPSEQLADRLFTRVLAGADFVFSMHGWTVNGITVPYVEINHHVPDTAEKSFRAAVASGFTIIRLSNWAPGLMTRVVNEAGIPGMEAEIGGMGTTRRKNRDLYKAHVVALMQHLGMLDGKPPPNPSPRVVEDFNVVCPVGGLIRVIVDLGAEVREGEILAEVFDLHGNRIHEIRAPVSGTIGTHRTYASVRPGEYVFRMFRDVENPITRGK